MSTQPITFAVVCEPPQPATKCPVCKVRLDQCNPNVKNPEDERLHYICERCLIDCLSIPASSSLAQKSISPSPLAPIIIPKPLLPSPVPKPLLEAGLTLAFLLELPAEVRTQILRNVYAVTRLMEIGAITADSISTMQAEIRTSLLEAPVWNNQ